MFTLPGAQRSKGSFTLCMELNDTNVKIKGNISNTFPNLSGLWPLKGSNVSLRPLVICCVCLSLDQRDQKVIFPPLVLYVKYNIELRRSNNTAMKRSNSRKCSILEKSEKVNIILCRRNIFGLLPCPANLLVTPKVYQVTLSGVLTPRLGTSALVVSSHAGFEILTWDFSLCPTQCSWMEFSLRCPSHWKTT